jgi:hypothetical protein
MILACNIDARGKKVRLIIGLLLLLAAILVGIAALERPFFIFWIIAAVLGAGGGFCVFEGWAGWCAVRAMGFKTRV